MQFNAKAQPIASVFKQVSEQVIPLPLGLFGLVVVVVVAFLVIGRWRQYRRLEHFRGPPLSGFSWLWHSRAVLSGRCYEHYSHVSQRYGPIARIGPDHLITSDADLWAKINAVRSPYRKSPWFYHAARFEPGRDNVFTDCEEDSHAARRKKLAPGYSGKEIPTLEASIDVHVGELIDLVGKYAGPVGAIKPSVPMDLAEKISFFTIDVISHIGLGEAFGDLKADKDTKDYLKALEIGLRIGNTSFAMGTSWLKETKVIGPAISPSEKDSGGFGRMMAEARRIVDQRRKKPADAKSDMIGSFMRHGVSGDDLFQEALEQLLAGSDTTSGGIRSILLYIITSPRVHAKLRAEIDRTVQSAAWSGIVPDAEARSLPYLGAVIREGLRVHPPVVVLGSRVTPESGDVVTVNGREYFIPGGTLIGYSAWAMHRDNRSLYGEDAHMFRPERWLLDESVAAEKARLASMTKVNDMIFSYGKWSCLGKGIALMELHKCLFELLRHFDLELVDARKPWKSFEALGLFKVTDMWVRVTRRA